MGKKLIIPETSKHPNFDFTIASQSFGKNDGVESLIIKFKTIRERDEFATPDFVGDTFKIGV